MSDIYELQQQINALNAKINQIESNAKRIDELPPLLDNISASDLLAVERSGVSYKATKTWLESLIGHLLTDIDKGIGINIDKTNPNEPIVSIDETYLNAHTLEIVNNSEASEETYIHFKNSMGSFVGGVYSPKSGSLNTDLTNAKNGSVATVYYKNTTFDLQGSHYGVINDSQFEANTLVLVLFMYDKDEDLIHVTVMGYDSDIPENYQQFITYDLPFDL